MFKSSTITVLAVALALGGCATTPDLQAPGAAQKRPVTHRASPVRSPKSPAVIQPSVQKPVQSHPSEPVTVRQKPTRAECEERVKQIRFRTLLGDQSRVKLRRKWWVNDCVAGKV